MYWTRNHEETVDGFDIVLHTTGETEPPDWDFESEEDRAETMRKIDDGTWDYFIARVTASKHGIVLGTDYLGGCCYDSVSQFVEDGDYYKGMVQEAIEEARETLEKLKEST